MKLLRLWGDFLSGATATTLGGWVLSLSPSFITPLVYAVALFILITILLLAFDDPVTEYLGIELPHYYFSIGFTWGAFIAGLAVLWGIVS